MEAKKIHKKNFHTKNFFRVGTKLLKPSNENQTQIEKKSKLLQHQHDGVIMILFEEKHLSTLT